MMKENDTDLKSVGRRLPVFLALCALLLLALIFLPVLAQDTPEATAGDPSPASIEAATPTPVPTPNFNEVDDPLNGEYELFTVNDLVIGRTKPVNNNTKSEGLNYILETENESISSQSVLDADNPDCWLTSGRQPQRTRVGRFFALPHDVILTLLPYGQYASGSECTAPAGQPNMALHIQSTQFGANTATPFTMSAAQTAVAMDDFDQDGFEDLFIMSDAEMLVATAENLADSNDGMRFGPATSLSPTIAAMSDPSTGDFNGDGLADVAWIGADYTVHFATVCPGAVEDTICSEATALQVLLDPDQSQADPIKVTPNYTVDPSGPGCTNDVQSLTSGDYGYSASGGDGLVVFDCIEGEYEQIFASWYQFQGDWTIFSGEPVDKIVAAEVFIAAETLPVSGRLDWFGNVDQVVLAVGSEELPPSGCFIYTVTMEWVGTITFQNGEMSANTIMGKRGNCEDLVLDADPWLNGLAIGHFSSIADDPSSETEFNQQFATLLNDGVVRIYSVNAPTDYTPELVHEVPLDSSLGLNEKDSIYDDSPLNWLASGDLQGRSSRLGPPLIVRVKSHTQPSIILGAPPMHVDYILPDSSTSSEWQVVNFSAIPDTYNSTYSMSQTTTTQSSDTDTTSYTYATSQESGGSVSLKIPDLPSISGAIKKSTENKNEDVSETYTYDQNEFVYNAATTTGFGDQIWYGQSSFNVYYYPVLGETVCPADNGSCSAGEEQQLYVTFSGPDSSAVKSSSGANIEWYQPVHEPGNIFSYPWNESQLAARIGQGIQVLSSPLGFFTDDSTQTQLVEWSSGSGQDQTTGTTNTHSYEKSHSMTGGKTIAEDLDVNLDGNVDYNSSTSIGTLNKSTSSIGASQGVAISKPGTFLKYQLYEYEVEPYLFGRVPPAGQVDTVNLPQDIQTAGPLQAAFAADPLNVGSWWSGSPYAQAIDVALNHPSRWTYTTGNFGEDSLNCLSLTCMVFNDPNPDDLWNSEFYWMRGLLVTVGGENGPQRLQATAGEEVILEARVYNYSFKDMDAGSSIKVRFYRQELSGTTPVGDSVLIAEQTMNPLPGFNSPNSPETPNWNSITAVLDTTDLGDTYQMFWVVVWVEDASGEMVPELQGHGLSAKPGTLTSIGDVLLEMVTVGEDQKTYSNNVGYLHSKFYIADETTGSPLPDADTQLEIVGATVTPAAAQPGEKVIVSALVAAEQAPADSVTVLFYPDAAAWYAYQDDPTLPQPRPFDVEMLPFIDVGTADRLEVPYSSSTCGKQTILIAAVSGVQGETATATASFDNGPCLAYLPVVPVQAPQ